MAKRKSIKREVAEIKAKITRDHKSERYAEVCKKSKVETLGDVCAVFYGLSRKAVEMAAFRRIMDLSALGYSPLEIIERMEAKDQKRK